MDQKSSPTTAEATAELLKQTARVRELHRRRVSDPALQRDLRTLARWQAARLLATYRDLAARSRYKAAMDFFLDDLYGPDDFSRRDADLERIVPTLASMLPARVLQTIAHAVELNALTTELDIEMLERMGPSGPDGVSVTVPRYCAAYRESGREPERRRQIELIAEVGRALEHYVHMPMLHAALKMMRLPARLAGFGKLQDFLERGMSSFAGLGDASEFLGTIVMRETALLEALLAGDESRIAEAVDPG